MGPPSYRRRPDVLWRASLHGVTARRAGGVTARIGPPGDAVWALLSSPRTVEELTDALDAAFGGPREAIRADVVDLLGRLVDLDVVVRTGSDGVDDLPAGADP